MTPPDSKARPCQKLKVGRVPLVSMSNRLTAVGATAESAVALALLAASRSTTEGGRSRHLVVGFAIGYLYRHSRAVSGCHRAREGPARTLSLTLGWLAVIAAVGRSLGGATARRRVGAGIALGSVGYRVARRRD